MFHIISQQEYVNITHNQIHLYTMKTGKIKKTNMLSIVRIREQLDLSDLASENMKWYIQEHGLAVSSKVSYHVTSARYLSKRNENYVHIKTCSCKDLFIAALFIIRNEKNNCPQTSEWINKMQSTHTTDMYINELQKITVIKRSLDARVYTDDSIYMEFQKG